MIGASLAGQRCLRPARIVAQVPIVVYRIADAASSDVRNQTGVMKHGVGRVHSGLPSRVAASSLSRSLSSQQVESPPVRDPSAAATVGSTCHGIFRRP
jgi:hypothetical protein